MESLLIAKVLKPQGIKGELKCKLFTDVVAAVTNAKQVIIQDNKCQVEKSVIRNGDLYLKLLGVNDRNNAEVFRNCEIFLPKKEIEKFKTSEFLVDDLIGMLLYDEKGNFIGQIVDYEDYGAAPIISVDCNGHVYEVPYIESIFSTKNHNLIVNKKTFEENKLWELIF